MIKRYGIIIIIVIFLFGFITCDIAYEGTEEAGSANRAINDLGCQYIDADTAQIWIDAGNAGWADVHYRVNNGGQLNYRMNKSGTYFYSDVNGLDSGDIITYSFTIGFYSGAQDTGWYTYTHGSTTPTPTPTPTSTSNGYTQGCTYIDSDSAQIWIDVADTGWVDVHYIVNSGGQLNYRMTQNGTYFYRNVNSLNSGDIIDYSFTIGFYAGAQDTGWYTYTHGSTTPTPTPTPTSTTTPTPTPTSTDGWQLVWSDEFNSGTTLNSTYWNYETGGSGWGNNELQYYTDRSDNVRVNNGCMEIIARLESYGGMNYTSARVRTNHKVYYTYGKIQARIRLSDTGMGLWPAFWMLGNNFDGSNWPACGEIDIMEHINNNPEIHGTIHWDADGYAYYGGETDCDVTGWHTYEIEWDSSSIKWFVDGVQYHEANILNNVNSTEEFHLPFFMILNIAVGGNWPGFEIDDSMFPITMYVDWIRWYQ